MIKRLKYKEIDFEKYTYCLENSAQKNWYAKKEILDHLSGNWELIVYGDYEAVMPINIKKKLGIQFVHMPLFCQQLGVFSKVDDPMINSKILNFLQKKYRVFLYCFNHHNRFATSLEKRKNYIIPVSDYEVLKRKKYFKGRKSAVKWSQHLVYKEPEFDEQVDYFISQNFKGLPKLSDFYLFKNYLSFLMNTKKLKLCAAFHEEKLINLAVLVAEKNQYSLLALINDEEFKKENGASFLIDKILSRSISEKSFNFMGSNIRGIEVFFKSFGAELYDYSFVENKFLKRFS